MDIYALIPARYASTRFPGKPLALISGKPMIQWVYELTVQAAHVKETYVATDDKRIRDAVLAFGGQVVMTSADAASGSDRIAEAAESLNMDHSDLIINVQGDQPLLKVEAIDHLCAAFQENNELQMATLAVQTRDYHVLSAPKNVKVVLDRDHFALYFSRSPIPFGRDSSDFDSYKHIGVYAYTKQFLDIFRKLPASVLEEIEKLEQLRVLEHGYKIKVIVTDFESPDVDLPGDIQHVEKLLSKRHT
ncbi:MAG: 3-deoxy-manno-octulosonate cytidylyltransferase [Acidobacteria bacterium]|nr:MAG: 3-deoxy-manno-octulosonate cytidylyltransferase [Acidobacteriota bacterium]